LLLRVSIESLGPDPRLLSLDGRYKGLREDILAGYCGWTDLADLIQEVPLISGSSPFKAGAGCLKRGRLVVDTILWFLGSIASLSSDWAEMLEWAAPESLPSLSDL